MNMPYRGETEAKKVTRAFVWWQHRRFLKRSFLRTPHVFLASRIAGDIDTLHDLKVPKGSIWAVERDPGQYRVLLGQRLKSRVFPQNVETVMERYASTDKIRSVYLDYCGNLIGMAKTTKRVISQLSEGSVVSITLFLGRELKLKEDRETALLRQVREATKHRVTLLQSIRYRSTDDKLGSMMCTWTFAIGGHPSRSKMRFDLTQELPSTEVDAATMWKQAKDLAAKRSRAAVKANITRQ